MNFLDRFRYRYDNLKELDINCFFDLPPNFELFIYKIKNSKLNINTNIDYINHFYNNGNDNNEIFSENIDLSWNKLKNDFYIKQIKP